MERRGGTRQSVDSLGRQCTRGGGRSEPWAGVCAESTDRAMWSDEGDRRLLLSASRINSDGASDVQWSRSGMHAHRNNR